MDEVKSPSRRQDHRDLKIRPVRPEDAEALNEVRRQPRVMEFTLAMPSETITFNRKFIEDLGPDDHAMVAEVAGRLVGAASLHVKHGKLRHSAELGIIVHDEFQGQGIGRALMGALLDLADNYLGLVRVELEVTADNERAIGLYKSLGFQTEGRKAKAVFRGGQYVDLLVMSRVRELGPLRDA